MSLTKDKQVPGPMPGDGPFDPAFHAAAELVGKRWTGAIVWALFHRRHRFGEIRDTIPGLSDRLLAERLKDLVARGIVEKRPVDGVEGYVLTRRGLRLRAVLVALHDWATEPE